MTRPSVKPTSISRLEVDAPLCHDEAVGEADEHRSLVCYSATVGVEEAAGRAHAPCPIIKDAANRAMGD
jgi:hypothetical protein